MSIIPKSWTGVDELRDQVWQLQQKVELLEMLYARVQQPRPVSVDPAGKIGHSVAPTPERALNAAAVLADAIAKHADKAPEVSPELEFYNAAGGYAWFKKNATAGKTAIGSIRLRTDKTSLPWKFDIGRRGQACETYGATIASTYFSSAGRSKSRCFATRREAEQFAFNVLTIHEAECIKRKAPTDWWNRVKIFEVIKR